MGRNKLRVKIKSHETANLIIQDEDLRGSVNTYIPSQHIKTVGIIRGIPQDLTNNEIEDFLLSEVPIESFERLNYWDQEKKCAMPGTSLKIVFRATTLPQEVKIFYIVKKVDYYISRPIICKNCRPRTAKHATKHSAKIARTKHTNSKTHSATRRAITALDVAQQNANTARQKTNTERRPRTARRWLGRQRSGKGC